MSDFSTVTQFELEVARYFGALHAVATDCCTHAIELCLRYSGERSAACPRRTYLSVPMTFMKLGLNWSFYDVPWQGYYYINKNIIDAAVFWEQQGYVAGTMMCLSFQKKKHLSLGRGGMILLDDSVAAASLRKMAYDGRERGPAWAEQQVSTIGYHYYMTPEVAEDGLRKLSEAVASEPRQWTSYDYPDISTLPVFSHASK